MSSRITTLMLAGLATTGLAVVGTAPVQAAPLPALTGDLVGGTKTNVDHVGWRRGYYGGGYGYRRRSNVGGALFAGAALGLIGGALAASAAPRYGYYGGYGYPAYGYGGYGYARPVYYGGYGGYGYPAYGGYYGGYGYGW
ncbi:MULTISPECIES: hypothetical protein [Methylorubrum]|uniref:BA14K family protein n=1 Tax=Methylorubrum suomiense TaxID=144191 RepID=A0ABQ4UNZ0_9HYPH|nr:hypothetical protein [Methylobacterium sp. L1A1]GJE73685.1 hypothetical protein BGCPKDLD_0251 [Methylorubrum suomiense]